MNAEAEHLYGTRYSVIKRYVDLLTHDGVEHGLIGPRELPRLWDRHILNSASLSGLLTEGATAVDVGSGAGLPGLPLAILRPDLQMTLLEPLLRRTTFLERVVDELDLRDQVQVVRSRAEDHRKTYDAVLSRAVAPLDRLIGWCAPLRDPAGVMLAVKGERAPAEVAAALPTLRRLRLRAEIVSVRATAISDPATVVKMTSAR